MDSEDARAGEALKEAKRARERAYAPYSRFKMGAAVVTAKNAVVPGALVENVSLGQGATAGDIDVDGQVDLIDFGVLKDNFGAALADRAHGDLSGDGHVDLSDFGILKVNFSPAVLAQLDADPAALSEIAAAIRRPLTSDSTEPILRAAALGLAMAQWADETRA